MKIHLMIIDPEHDFCHPGLTLYDKDGNEVDHPFKEPGSLYVPGAEEDMARVAAMITRLDKKIEDIHVTLDSHHLIDVAHPQFWLNSQMQHPDIFTIITKEDVLNGVWRPFHPAYQNRRTMKGVGLDRDGVEEYVTALETNGRYPLCIWPPHTRIGTVGATVVQPLSDVLKKWEEDNLAMVDYVTKGSNFLTEHYSAVQADVPDPKDPNTQLNQNLIDILEDADEILWTGEAKSHCLSNTARDIANNFGEENIKKFVLLEDATSNVPGFEQLGEDFVKEMKDRGMRVSTTTEYLK